MAKFNYRSTKCTLLLFKYHPLQKPLRALLGKMPHPTNINTLAEKSSWSDWGSNLRLMATPPSTIYQHFSPLSQIAILKKMESGIQAWYLSTRHAANSGEHLYTQCLLSIALVYINPS
jgi:hypothetical protein